MTTLESRRFIRVTRRGWNLERMSGRTIIQKIEAVERFNDGREIAVPLNVANIENAFPIDGVASIRLDIVDVEEVIE